MHPATPSQPRPGRRLRLRRWRAALASSDRRRSLGKRESCHGEFSRLLGATPEAQERATSARHPQECGRGTEAQARAAHEEPGETRRGLHGHPEYHLFTFRRLCGPVGPPPPPPNSGTQSPNPGVRPREGAGCPGDSELSCALCERPHQNEGAVG